MGNFYQPEIKIVGKFVSGHIMDSSKASDTKYAL